MKPIPTKIDGIQFRSKLEARWYLFMKRLQWRIEYEPQELPEINGWIPDFMIIGKDKKILVDVKPIYSVIGLAPFCYGVISSNHIVAGFFGICIGLWHISSRPGPLLYKLLKMGNVEEVLSIRIAAVFFTAFVISALMWAYVG